MKVFNVIGVATIGVIIAFPKASIAQVGPPSWIQGGCDRDSKGCFYFKVISRKYPFVMVETRNTYEKSKDHYWRIQETQEEFNCDKWTSRIRHYASRLYDSKSGKWGPYKWHKWNQWWDIYPGTVAESNLRAVCG